MRVAQLINGLIEWVKAIAQSAGVGDAGKLIITDATGKLDSSFMPTGAYMPVQTITATETLAAGDFVNVYNSTGEKCRLADATDASKPAHGFVLAAVDANDPAEVYLFNGINNVLSGLTPGARYYLCDSPAVGYTATPIAETTGYIHQYLGIAISTTELLFQYNEFGEFV
jgi:hypothetical protein